MADGALHPEPPAPMPNPVPDPPAPMPDLPASIPDPPAPIGAPSAHLAALMSARHAPQPAAGGGEGTMIMIGGVIVVVVVGVVIYFQSGDKSSAPSPPPPKPCPVQTNCQAGCRPTNYRCTGAGSVFSSSNDDCSQSNCCSGASKGSFLNFSGATCKDKNDSHYPCTCNGVLMNSSGVVSNKSNGGGGGCTVM